MSLAAQITPTGMSVPSYEDILASLIFSFKGIFGNDVYLGTDSQDYEMLAIFALAISDCNQMALATYNAFSPSTAQGVGLSSVVKINGLRRLASSKSTVDLTIVGQAGTIITNGIAIDLLSNRWALPTTVTIPIGGSIVVTATAIESGDIPAASDTVNKIGTPTLGWQSVNNANPATLGAPVEQDATLRQRQAASTTLPALSVIDAIIASVANIFGVQRYEGYENPTGSTDGNGIPAHSISLVVQGGDVQVIGETIANKKTPGTGTYGTTAIDVVDSKGIPSTINFYVLTEVVITVEIDITALTGYVSPTEDAIKVAVAEYLSALAIGEDVNLFRMGVPINLNGDPLSDTYAVTGVRIARDGGMPTAANIVIAFNEAASCAINNITIAVT